MKKRILAIGITISGILVVVFTIPIADFLTSKIYNPVGKAADSLVIAISESEALL